MAQETKDTKEEEIRYFVRVSNTDLDGTKTVKVSLTGIKGVGRHTSRAITMLAGVDGNDIMGKLPEEAVDRLRAVVENYQERVPFWMVNRPKDFYSGENRHLFSQDVALVNEEDINLLRKIRCYRGIRHETGQKVRGQRTKSTGRTGSTVGVKRKKE